MTRPRIALTRSDEGPVAKKTVNEALGSHRWFANAKYLGGTSKFTEGWHGFLFFTTEAIGLGKTATSGPQETVIPRTYIVSVEVTGRQVAKSRVDPVIVFGLIGLAARGSQDRTTIVVRTTTDEAVHYSIDGMSPEAVRAGIAPVLKLANIPFHEERPAARPQPMDVADQIRKLATLRDEGLLTDEEFAAQKAKLLSN
jgi:hypothetical protein